MTRKRYIYPKVKMSPIYTFSVICGSNPPDKTGKEGEWEAPARVSRLYV